MGIANVLRNLLPKENKFFELFTQNMENIKEATTDLRKLLDATTDSERKILITKIKSAESAGDLITHAIFQDLSHTFITPIDREDIHALAAELDDILDLTEDTAIRINLYGVYIFPQEFRDLTDTLLRAVDDLGHAIPLLHMMKNHKEILKRCEDVNACENAGDDIYHNTIAKLFREVKEPIELIKYKEILGDIEEAIDKCEHVANLIEGVVIKYA
jgi:uncharacterized protein Yka (UPF0111/DUF47 family)